MCPSEHVWPASQHPLQGYATIIKKNNVGRFFVSESTTFLYYRSPKKIYFNLCSVGLGRILYRLEVVF